MCCARGLYDGLSVREECLVLRAGWVVFFFGMFDLVFNRNLKLVVIALPVFYFSGGRSYLRCHLMVEIKCHLFL